MFNPKEQWKIIIFTGQWELWAVTAIRLPFQLGQDSSFQNTAEFMVVVMDIVTLARRGVVGAPIALLGDNTSSLAWASKERFKEGRSQHAATSLMKYPR